MKYTFCVFVALAGVLLCGFVTLRTISSSTEGDGNQHPAKATINETATIKCVSATGANPQTYRPVCQIQARGYYGEVKPGDQVGVSGPGTVTLTCGGQAPANCSATIYD